MPTVSETISIMKVSQYLASADIAKGAVFGSKVDPNLPMILWVERYFLEKIYNLNPDQEDIQAVADYCYALCQSYAFEAVDIITNGVGGIIGGGWGVYVPISKLPIPPLDWIVSNSGSPSAPLKTGDVSVLLNGTNGMVDLRGYNIDFVRGGLPQRTTDAGDGSLFYSWDINSGLFSLMGTNPAATIGEQMRISPSR